jgi:hypothetical protein
MYVLKSFFQYKINYSYVPSSLYTCCRKANDSYCRKYNNQPSLENPQECNGEILIILACPFLLGIGLDFLYSFSPSG